MKRLSFVVVLCALAAMPAQAALMHTANVDVGNQGWSGVGLQFTVNSPGIVVQQLGVYDSGSNGIAGTLTTDLFNTATQAVLAQQTFSAAQPGVVDPVSNYWLKPITPLVLAPGNYTIMAYGFSDATDLEHNSTLGGQGPTFNTGGGAITFFRDAWTGSSVAPPGTFPDQFGPYPPTPLVPQDYFDGPNMVFNAVPVPGAVLLGFLGLGVAGLKLRKVV